MSYLVLARRFRPQRFSDLVGQPHVARTLLNSLRQNRVAHAYLFNGPRGVGKTTTARLLARAINCLHPEDYEPCGTCHPCTTIADGHFIDVIEIDAASNNGVEDVRQLREGIRYTPIEGKAKIYIIDEVHMLSMAAFNALLKTLEEPPAHAYFCLATTNPQKVPQTILSRCQRFDFRRVSFVDIRNHLEKICRTDGIEFEEEALGIIARRAEGSVRDSLGMLDQVISFTGDHLTKQDTIDVIGEVRLDLYYRAVDLVNSASIEEAFLLDEELTASGTDPKVFLSGLESYLVQILRIQALGADVVDIPPENKDDYVHIAEELNQSDIIRLLQLSSAAEMDVRRNFNPRVRLQLLLLKFASFDRSVILADLIRRFEGNIGPSSTSSPSSGGGSSAPKRDNPTVPHKSSQPSQSSLSPSPTQPKPTTPPARHEVSDKDTVTVTVVRQPSPDDPLSAAQGAWNDICDRVSKEYNSQGNMIRYGGYPYSYEDGELTIRFRDKPHLNMGRRCVALLREGLEGVIGSVRIKLEEGELPNHTESGSPVESDPAVRLLKDRLDARPVNY